MMETRDYSKFKMHSANRVLSESTVNKLVNSIREVGYIKGKPVLVDENMRVVDGQHRLEALKRLHMPIPYEIVKGDSFKSMVVLNANQVQWRLIDYIESYANQNKDEYRFLLKFQEKYKLGVSNSIAVVLTAKSTAADIRRGKPFDINPQANDIAEYILSCEVVPFYKQQAFVSAIVHLFRKANKEQLKTVRDHILSVPKCHTVGQYLTVFENILNYRKRGRNKIKF